MSNTIKLRRSAVQGAIPTTAQLALGELALNTYDGKLYTKKDDGTPVIVEIGGGGGGASVTISDVAPSSPSAGDLWWDSVGGKLYVYYTDADSSQWVQTNGGGEVPGKIEEGNTSIEAIDTGVDGRVVITTEGVEALRVDSSQRVGIGSTTAEKILTVLKNGDSGLYIKSADTNHSNLQLGVDTANSYSFIQSGSAGSGSALNMAFFVGSTERARLDTSGRLLVGTSSGSAPSSITVQGNSASSTGEAVLRLCRGTTSPANGDELGQFLFGDSNQNNCAIFGAYRDGGTWNTSTSRPTRLVFSTTADGASSPTERMRIAASGYIQAPGIYNITTASAANVFVNSNGVLYRSTSSIKYKTDIETLQNQYADAILNIRPVWYRSLNEQDNPDHSYWGFIAEEVAAIDPRLVHWKTVEVTYNESGSVVETPCDPEPEGVAYDRFVPHLLNLIKRQGEAIADLQAEVAALKAQ